MPTDHDPVADELLPAWTAALPAVLRLLPDRERRMFRQELQRFLAFHGMKPDEAVELVAPLREVLLQALRAAAVPPALHATRSALTGPDAMARLCSHLLAEWRAAEAPAEAGCAVDPSGRSGEVFFGPRLGGPGRPGSVGRDEPT